MCVPVVVGAGAVRRAARRAVGGAGGRMKALLTAGGGRPRRHTARYAVLCLVCLSQCSE